VLGADDELVLLLVGALPELVAGLVGPVDCVLLLVVALIGLVGGLLELVAGLVVLVAGLVVALDGLLEWCP
jgi:hypothetical protein